MNQRDLLLDMIREFARFVAMLLGLIKKDELEEAEKQINIFLNKHFQLNSTFTFEELQERVESGNINIKDLSGILDIVLLRAKMNQLSNPKSSQSDAFKALKIFELIEAKATIFDLSLVQKKKEIENYL